MTIRQCVLSAILIAFAAITPEAAHAQASLPTLNISINGHSIKAEVASTVESRMRGLMHREKLGKHEGMLFVFDEVGYHSMWMKNTLIPLSVAFIDEKGRIINIANMEPHAEVLHSATAPARFALETNVGWFKARNIGPGAMLKGLEKAPEGR